VPITFDCSLDELQAKTSSSILSYTDTVHKFGEATEKKELNLQLLAIITENHENIIKKFDSKTHEYDHLIEQMDDEQSRRYQIQQQIKTLTKKSIQLNEDILKHQNKLTELTKKQSKVNHPFISLSTHSSLFSEIPNTNQQYCSIYSRYPTRT
jgi:predicted nuclease with TOPRIM domain